ncbi:hypothetical protein ACFFOS_27315 [Nocardioides kongjuensis]|uniref:DUF3558 domain-containing protein n=1 Tax=Nocardioides kongjuensis TaxID=349522 RepID=A0A852RCM5_9ACTN|nr:hypothetical protein [Nocardioides kongjuensis]NYD32753.1 hypothetical protein [Nocardioides kongjuensis]
MNRTKLAVVTAMLVPALMACSSGDDGKDAADGKAGKRGDEASDSASAIVAPSVEPTFKGAISSLADVACEASNGVWSGKGTLTNSGNKKRTFEVTYSVIKSATSEVLGAKSRKVQLAPGESQAIDFAAIYDKAPKGTQCVQRVIEPLKKE